MRLTFLTLCLTLLSAGYLFSDVRVAQAAPSPSLWINEIMADNDSVVADEHGDYDDVFELYNAGDTDVSLGGMYLTDDLADPKKFRIPDGVTIAAGGYLLFWADSDPAQGATHTNFSLSKDGESLGLFDTDASGNAQMDGHTFGPQVTDQSEGRCPDGGPTWTSFTTPTLGATNQPCSAGVAPVIDATEHTPAFPKANELVTVSAIITDDGVITATLWYSAGLAFTPIPMADSGGGVYLATIPPHAQDTPVQYYVTAEDATGKTAADPAAAPDVTYSYVAGFLQSPIVINELMADNETALGDPDVPGQYPDWIELYNAGAEPVDLGGFYLTDDLANPTQYAIPPGTVIPAGGYLLFYADGEPEQGPQHTNFALGAGGEAVGLFAVGGLARVDAVVFPAQEPDLSYGRLPDGTGGWKVLVTPTPGAPNDAGPGVYLPLIVCAATPPSLPLRLDSAGSEGYVARDGTVYQPDRAYAPCAPYGYVGGYADVPKDWWDSYAVGHTREQMLYQTQRLAWQEYRTGKIPNGDYLLTLRFAEQVVHGRGQSVFDIVVEGETVAAGFDAYAQVGRYYALDRRFAVTLTDGELNLQAVPVAGEPHLAALELVPRTPDTTAPAAPSELTVTPSYNALLIDWPDSKEDDVAGYYVYRAYRPEGPYTRLAGDEMVYTSRAQDRVSAAHAPHYYRVSAVDVYGNESDQSDYAEGAALGLADATLPLYQLEVAPQNLARLAVDPFADVRMPGTFTWQDRQLAVEVRYRGGLSRTFDKKSWKVVFARSESPFPNHDRINVNACFLDESLIRCKLANDLYAAAGLRPPQAEHVLLTLNGDYMGVYTRNEQVDEGFLRNSGRNPGASIYKAVWRFLEPLASEAAYRTSYEKETNTGTGYADLIQFVEFVNHAPEDVFARELDQILDVEAFLAYYAVNVLISNIDSTVHNVYLVHDLATGQWELIPWDLDGTFSLVEEPIDMGSSNILRQRVLRVPAMRVAYCRLLDEYMNTIFSDEVLHPQVDALYAQIAADGQRDWRKSGWESDSPLTTAPKRLKQFITERKVFLRSEMAGYCPSA